MVVVCESNKKLWGKHRLIAKELKVYIFKYEEMDKGKLFEYDTIIYGGSFYAAGVTGSNIIEIMVLS